MEKQIAPLNVGLKWGLLIGLLLCLMTTTYAFFSIYGPWYVTSGILYALLLGGVIMGIREFKSGNNGLSTLGQGLFVGMIIIALGALISMAYTFSYNNYIDPDSYKDATRHGLAMIVKGGWLTEVQADEAFERELEIGLSIREAVYQYVAYFIFGFIMALITAAIMQKKKHSPAERS